MESVVRGLVVYLFLLLVFRVSGKRTLSETTSFDLVLLLIISETTQQAMVNDDHSFTNAAILITTLVGMDVVLSLIKQASPAADRWLDGAPQLLVRGGRLLEANMRQERIDKQDILEAGREQEGLHSLAQIELAVLERSGKISVVPRAAAETRK
jgi:uncharacterized membrane protein YcaP (DUF421 family)